MGAPQTRARHFDHLRAADNWLGAHGNSLRLLCCLGGDQRAKCAWSSVPAADNLPLSSSLPQSKAALWAGDPPWRIALIRRIGEKVK